MHNAEFKRVNENRGAFEGKFINNYKLFSVIKITPHILLF